MVQENRLKVFVITGATGLGKSAMAVKAAKRYNGEIISADSMQVYRTLDIGTGKITKRQMGGIKHHLIDIVNPDEEYSVGRFVKDAAVCIKEITDRGKLPIVVGGTGLYITSLLNGDDFADAPSSKTLRIELALMNAIFGNAVQYRLLELVDPISAEKISKNDIKRVHRALEIYIQTGKPKSLKASRTPDRYNYSVVVMDAPREVMYERINNRVDQMFCDGLIDEVRAHYVNRHDKSMQAIGYKEVVYGLLNAVELYDIVDLVKRKTRNYAKRQETYFKHMKVKKTFVSYYDETSVYKAVEELINDKRG